MAENRNKSHGVVKTERLLLIEPVDNKSTYSSLLFINNTCSLTLLAVWAFIAWEVSFD
jgi:hypothetical protein